MEENNLTKDEFINLQENENNLKVSSESDDKLPTNLNIENKKDVLTYIENDDDATAFLKGKKIIKNDIFINKPDKNIKNDVNKSESKNNKSEKKDNSEGKQMTKKEKLVNDIMTLSDKLGQPKPSKRKLTRTKISLLEKQLANIVNSASSDIITDTLKQRSQEIKDKEEEDLIPIITNETAVNTLYDVHLVGSDFLESSSKLVKDFTGGVTLEGMTKKLLSKEEQLKELLKKIVEEHQAIKKYLTPTTAYFLMLGSIISQTIMDNVKKKPQQCTEQLC